MKKLKIIFVESIPKKLMYSIYELKKQDNGFYKIERADIFNKPYDFFLENNKRYCYMITPENKLIELIHQEHVIELDPVVENLYTLKECNENNFKPKRKVFK